MTSQPKQVPTDAMSDDGDKENNSPGPPPSVETVTGAKNIQSSECNETSNSFKWDGIPWTATQVRTLLFRRVTQFVIRSIFENLEVFDD